MTLSPTVVRRPQRGLLDGRSKTRRRRRVRGRCPRIDRVLSTAVDRSHSVDDRVPAAPETEPRDWRRSCCAVQERFGRPALMCSPASEQHADRDSRKSNFSMLEQRERPKSPIEERSIARRIRWRHRHQQRRWVGIFWRRPGITTLPVLEVRTHLFPCQTTTSMAVPTSRYSLFTERFGKQRLGLWKCHHLSSIYAQLAPLK